MAILILFSLTGEFEIENQINKIQILVLRLESFLFYANQKFEVEHYDMTYQKTFIKHTIFEIY